MTRYHGRFNGTREQSSRQSPAPTGLYLFDQLATTAKWEHVVQFINGRLEVVERRKRPAWVKLAAEFRTGAVDV